MNAIKYLKLDLRIIRKSMKYYTLVPIIFYFIFSSSTTSYVFTGCYLFFILTILATIPFTSQDENSDTVYYMLPSKIQDIVFGRFIYLIILFIVISLINGFSILHLYKIGEIHNFEIIIICLCEIASIILCLVQYPIYYKMGSKKGQIISMLIYFVPALVIFTLLSLLIDDKFFLNKILSYAVNFIVSNKSIIILLNILVILALGYMSYLISCRICKNKEL